MRLVYRERGNATGNLEICFNNLWLSLCGLDGDIFATAAVACRALGFTEFDNTEQEHTPIPPIVVEEGPIFTEEPFCRGFERNLTECELDRRRKRGVADSFETDSCTRENVLRIQCLCKLISQTLDKGELVKLLHVCTYVVASDVTNFIVWKIPP